jgi:hypothetical protein
MEQDINNLIVFAAAVHCSTIFSPLKSFLGLDFLFAGFLKA